ncbi:hypothetical protein PN462_08915 [Spirulina sp. CS-785/01]|uniref:hypothetical protein n=1 Tax=Spirulina sp. CS-785/01 TaxID=3021716 RepID=UPI00232FE26C|nr:hypothetical protein [Spirulina sp. CS-785/01]MDB9313218.1 hypothetical protein [Spirulina sp. CS-785/01]
MNIDQQIQQLIARSPDDGVTPLVVEKAVAPVLRAFAEQMTQRDYYVMQTLENGWVLTTLSNRNQPGVEKKVIYAFASLKDANAFQETPDPNLIATSLPVTHILFQLFALSQVDSLVFMDTPGNLSQGKEVKRQDLQHLVQLQLKNSPDFPNPPQNNIPPDLA